ncbi:nucleotide exchange factor GrpE [Halogeometricum limi]|uniref:Protein GrpE n=1 Tax=Halogeometricum limi TaxID=555875 RepID=A0A1I6IPZ5_9EURY|nr:nucleotide exchange factor GrpE [Halogeometricum limi]SFR68788.1 molecular chaperone GrpE [Halogeometricum limi]
MTDDSPDGRTSGRADVDETPDRGAVDGSDATPDSDASDGDAAPEEGADAATAGEGTHGEELVSRVAEYDEELADDVAALRGRVQRLETELAATEEERDELTDRLKRTQADFQNYKKRAKKRQDQIRETATEDFVERVVTVRDNLVRALDQDEDADIRPGVESTLEEFDRILSTENVTTIDPEPGKEVDPARHEVMMRVDSEQPEGTVADVYQPGYEMAEKVIRAAQITVSTGEDEE